MNKSEQYQQDIGNHFKAWKSKPPCDGIDHPASVFISDGIVCPGQWFSQKVRPLFLLKEAYHGSGDWKVHGLDPSKRLLLELAAILHSCGSFVNVRQHNQCTFDLIKGMDIFGLRQRDVLETAFVAGSISDNLSVEENPDFAWLPMEERIVVTKMAAIFRLANALDKSHRGKIRDLKVSLDEDRVVFKAKSADNTLLERWAFEESAQFFKEVFGLSPELSIKFDIMI